MDSPVSLQSEGLEPPSLKHLAQTELANPHSKSIDTLDTTGILSTINTEDKLVAEAVEKAIPQISRLVEATSVALRSGHRLFYVGAGTSGRLGVLDAAECPPTYSTPPDWVQGIIAGGDTALKLAVEGAEDSAESGRQVISDYQIQPGDVLIGLSASGCARYVSEALVAAKEAGISTGCITCSPNSVLLTLADFPVLVETGPEVITGSTRMKAGTAQKLVLNMISTATMIQLGKTYGHLMVDVKPTNKKLRARAIRLVSALAQCPEQDAEALLEAGHWEVKTAVVMHLKSLDYTKASEALQAHNGKLKPLIG
jgi:N-acetylmuramic acid 6-phosphate etherase